VANALDLSQYDDEMFSTILLFGPLYHLMKHEVIKCLEEVRKKLQPGGTVFAVYMPYEVGVKSILERALSSPDQVDGANLERLIKSGHFRNHAIQGFQEAYFPRTSQITDYFERTGYVVEDTRSIRGIGYGNDEGIMELQDSNPARFAKILATINDTARLESVVNTGGHALITARIA
jgi:hypothetical protein